MQKTQNQMGDGLTSKTQNQTIKEIKNARLIDNEQKNFLIDLVKNHGFKFSSIGDGTAPTIENLPESLYVHLNPNDIRITDFRDNSKLIPRIMEVIKSEILREN